MITRQREFAMLKLSVPGLLLIASILTVPLLCLWPGAYYGRRSQLAETRRHRLGVDPSIPPIIPEVQYL